MSTKRHRLLKINLWHSGTQKDQSLQDSAAAEKKPSDPMPWLKVVMKRLDEMRREQWRAAYLVILVVGLFGGFRWVQDRTGGQARAWSAAFLAEVLIAGIVFVGMFYILTVQRRRNAYRREMRRDWLQSTHLHTDSGRSEKGWRNGLKPRIFQDQSSLEEALFIALVVLSLLATWILFF